MDASIQCKVCGGDLFTLRLRVGDNQKSIIAYCSCGRAVEYVDVKEAVLISGV